MPSIRKVRADKKYVYAIHIAEYLGKRIVEIRNRIDEIGAQNLTDDERALLFVNDEMSDMMNSIRVLTEQKEIIVPSSECMEMTELYARTQDELNALKLALRQSGCPETEPLKVMDWIRSIAK